MRGAAGRPRHDGEIMRPRNLSAFHERGLSMPAVNLRAHRPAAWNHLLRTSRRWLPPSVPRRRKKITWLSECVPERRHCCGGFRRI